MQLKSKDEDFKWVDEYIIDSNIWIIGSDYENLLKLVKIIENNKNKLYGNIEIEKNDKFNELINFKEYKVANENELRQDTLCVIPFFKRRIRFN